MVIKIAQYTIIKDIFKILKYLLKHFIIYKDNEFIFKKFLCAIGCGFTSLIFTYPYDTIRVRLSLEFSREKRDRLY